jgi:hypothetical protein
VPPGCQVNLFFYQQKKGPGKNRDITKGCETLKGKNQRKIGKNHNSFAGNQPIDP